MSERRDLGRERLVRVAVAENPMTAETIRAQLDQAGIRSMLKNLDGLSVVQGPLASPWSIEVWVLEGDADAAATILGGRPAGPALASPALEGTAHRRSRLSRLFGRNK